MTRIVFGLKLRNNFYVKLTWYHFILLGNLLTTVCTSRHAFNATPIETIYFCQNVI